MARHAWGISERARGLLLVAFRLIPFVCVYVEEAHARAGGAHSSGFGGWLNYIYVPFVVYGLYRGFLLLWKVRVDAAEARKDIAKFSATDPRWEMSHLEAVVREAFPKVQQAWMERNQDICRDYVTDRCYAVQKSQTDEAINSNRKNILERVGLGQVKIVQAEHNEGSAGDRFWAFLQGTMVDYEVDTTTNCITKGNRKLHGFHELWHFVRQGDRWLLDEIDSYDTLGELDAIRDRMS